MNGIYLDNAATTATRPEVVEAMRPYYTEIYGNPSSLHTFGQRAKCALEGARQTVADLLDADPKEIYFTSGGTESNNLAIKGAAIAYRHRGNHLITSAIEHHAVLNVFEELAQQDFEITVLPVDRHGVIDAEALKAAIRPSTLLISVMLANNEIGTIQPVAEIARLAREHGILIHTDAVQAVGKIPVSVSDLDVDFLSLTAHKFYGPKGIGVLYARHGRTLKPLLQGGHQERILRPGTENIPGAVGLATALRLAYQDLGAESGRIGALRARLENGIQSRLDQVTLNGHPQQRVPNIANLSFAFVEGEALLLALDTMGIAVSTASACSAGSTEPSHVLTAIGVAPLLAEGAIRFSLGRTNTSEEIDYVIDSVAEAVTRLRELSPLGGARTAC